MSNGKLWLSFEKDDPQLLEEWAQEEKIDVRTCRINGSRVLNWTGQLGKPNITKALLKKIPANTRDSDGEQPIHAAARTGKVAVLNLLVKAGAPLNAQSNDGQTALMVAAMRQQVAYMKKLLELGADTSIRDNDGNTVEQYAHTLATRRLLSRYTRPMPIKVVSGTKPVTKVVSAKKVEVKKNAPERIKV